MTLFDKMNLARNPHRFDRKTPLFDGPKDYQTQADEIRLTGQLLRVYNAMKDGAWLAVHNVAQVLREPETSVSAQIRNLRKAKHGGHIVERKREGNLSFYRLVKK
jgi:hypothetical protein